MNVKLMAIGPVALGLVASCGPMDEQDVEQGTESSELSARFTDPANERIPDNDPIGIVRILSPDLSWDLVRQLRVSVSVRHTYRGDLRVTLEAPDGREVVLHNQSGGSADNLRINRVIHDFDGLRASGPWTLQVSDHEAKDTGVLESWGLAMETVPGPTPCDTTTCEAGTHCELEQVQCIRAPCWPVPVCVPDATDVCADFQCPGGQHCEPQIIYCIRAPCPPPIPQCVPSPTCDPSECTGPAPRGPTVQCWDGSFGGPTCARGGDGLCGWTIRQCPPEPTGPFCGTRGNEVYCAANEYCHYEPNQLCGAADAQGVCRPKPEACTMIYAPVCGCDNQTHSSACVAAGAGTSVQYNGPCGAWDQKGADFGTTQPYRNNQRLTQTFYAPPDGTKLKLHFDRFETEQGYDFVTVFDANGVQLARWSGRLRDMAPEVTMPQGTNVTVVFTSDASVTGAGFHIQAISWWRAAP